MSPLYVIFSSGHGNNRHPRASAAERYINNGVRIKNIFRTDLGDDDNRNKKYEPCKQEWTYGTIPNYRDKEGDDNIKIVLKKEKQIAISYY